MFARSARSLSLILALVLTPQLMAAEGRSIIVLDASGSMWGQIDGRPKLEIAREALAGVLAELPADSEVGLMAYGHRTKGDCADIELIVPPGPGTGPAIAAAAANMQFLGKTPLTDAVRQAAAALRSTEAKATVILITDGVETCAADPCALGRELEASGVDFTAHVVGFGLTSEEGAQVACLAENTGGQYLTAGDLASLTFALQTTVVTSPTPIPPPTPKPATLPVIKATPKPVVVVEVENNLAPVMLLVEGGEAIQTDIGQAWEVYPLAADGGRGETLITTIYEMREGKLPPGNYMLVGKLGSAHAEMPITLTKEATATPILVMNASPVTLRARAIDAGPVEQDAIFEFTLPDNTVATAYATNSGGEITTYMPAGIIPFKVTLGEATASDTLTLTAGQKLDRDIIVASGVAVINGFYVEGLLLESSSYVTVESKAKGLTGQRENFGAKSGQDGIFTLPPGDYVAVFVLDQHTYEPLPFSVEQGKRIEVPVILNAGVLAISAPGAAYIDLKSPTPDANGNRALLNGTSGETFQSTLPAGDYFVVAYRGDTRVEAAVTVTAGARTEIDLPVP